METVTAFALKDKKIIFSFIGRLHAPFVCASFYRHKSHFSLFCRKPIHVLLHSASTRNSLLFASTTCSILYSTYICDKYETTKICIHRTLQVQHWMDQARMDKLFHTTQILMCHFVPAPVGRLYSKYVRHDLCKRVLNIGKKDEFAWHPTVQSEQLDLLSKKQTAIVSAYTNFSSDAEYYALLYNAFLKNPSACFKTTVLQF